MKTMIKYKKTAKAKELEERHNLQHITTLDFAPKRATDGSSGFDLRACIEQPITLNSYDVAKIGTGVHIWIGKGDEEIDEYMLFAGLLMPRSSSDGAILNNTIGLLDSDYMGELFCKYRNLTNRSITFEPGERFSQLIIVPTFIAKMNEVDSFDNETNTLSSVVGFG